MNGLPIVMTYYDMKKAEQKAEQMREHHNEFIQRQMDQAKQSRENYFVWLQNQQDIARRESERLRNQIYTQIYGETQVAEPVEREAEAYVVEQAAAEVQECNGCLQCQANQMAHMGPGGCLYEEEEEIEQPSELTRQVAERISNDEVIVLNGNHIECD